MNFKIKVILIFVFNTSISTIFYDMNKHDEYK